MFAMYLLQFMMVPMFSNNPNPYRRFFNWSQKGVVAPWCTFVIEFGPSVTCPGELIRIPRSPRGIGILLWSRTNPGGHQRGIPQDGEASADTASSMNTCLQWYLCDWAASLAQCRGRPWDTTCRNRTWFAILGFWFEETLVEPDRNSKYHKFSGAST